MKKQTFSRLKKLCVWLGTTSLTAGALAGVVACGDADNVADDDQVREVKRILDEEFSGTALSFEIPEDYKNIESVKKEVNTGLANDIRQKLDNNAEFNALPFVTGLAKEIPLDVQQDISNLISDGLAEVSSEGTFDLFSKGQNFTIDFRLVRGVRIINHQVSVKLKPVWAEDLVKEKLGDVLDQFYDYLNGRVTSAQQLEDSGTKTLPILINTITNLKNEDIEAAIKSYWDDYLLKNDYERNLVSYLEENTFSDPVETALKITTYPTASSSSLGLALELGDWEANSPKFSDQTPEETRVGKIDLVEKTVFKSPSPSDTNSFANKVSDIFEAFKETEMLSFWMDKPASDDEKSSEEEVWNNFVEPQTNAILEYLNSANYGNLITHSPIYYDPDAVEYDANTGEYTFTIEIDSVTFEAPGESDQGKAVINDLSLKKTFTRLDLPSTEEDYADVIRELNLTGDSWKSGDDEKTSLFNIDTDGSYLIGSDKIKISTHGSTDLNKQLLKMNDRRSVFIRNNIKENASNVKQQYTVGHGPNTVLDSSNTDYSDVSFIGNYEIESKPDLNYNIKNTDKMSVSFNNNYNSDNTWFEELFWPALENAGLDKNIRDNLQVLREENPLAPKGRGDYQMSYNKNFEFNSLKSLAVVVGAALNELINARSIIESEGYNLFKDGLNFIYEDKSGQKVKIGFNPLNSSDDVYKAIDYIGFDNLESNSAADWSWALSETLSELQDELLPEALQPLSSN